MVGRVSCFLLSLLFLLEAGSGVQAFSYSFAKLPTAVTRAAAAAADASSSSTCLYMSSSPPTPPQRKARRDLKKRRRRSRNNNQNSSIGRTNKNEDDEFWLTAESRPVSKSRAIELGQDYWIDEEELKREKEREELARVKKPGQVPDEKLWTEVLSPYKQNWIGLFSVLIVILTFLIQKFPELTDYPIIPLPDL